MGRKKSALRRAVSPRQLRWRASRALICAAPFLRRPLNFHGSAVSIAEAAQTHLFEDAMIVDRPFDEAETRFVAERAREHDGPAEPEYWRAPWRFSVDYHLLGAVEMLSHTGCLADLQGRGLVTTDGAQENWNRDKIALLSSAAPVEAVALPVRRYTNYFHFMLEAAMPLVAYFEHPARAFGPHAIVSAPISAGFVRDTLKAIAQRYQAAFVELSPRSKVRLEKAVAYVRRSPCSDWPMARPETASALRGALLSYFGSETNPDPVRRLYLKRGHGKIRNLTNAADLDALAMRRGLEILEPASENLLQQIKFAAEAELILAVHGAALANLLFAKPDAEVVEVFSEDFCKSVYLMLARQLGLRHRPVICGAGDYRQNFQIDLEKLDSVLAEAGGC